MQERRRLILKTGAFLGASYLLSGNLPVLAYAQEAPFPWTREEVLFGPEAGFEKARTGVPLLVWADPSLANFNLVRSIHPWNKMALNMGRGHLFQPTVDESEADVKFIPGSTTKVVPSPDYIHPYKNSLVFSVPYLTTEMAIHELGHTLGLVDFVKKITNISGYVNPARCDDPDKQYHGVMSYCDIYQTRFWFGRDDQRLLSMALEI